ncbi:D-glycero-beta-D-manno-heptose 1,7-bisphosphate 7-phosphatase [Desulfosarcina sp. OttesenSCG-928-A07]|nr:D-glycero-beta-D-manno-heptose 1,7-bisphosphate 7-phosphatase [Desulfosarcina sp. OttesenSCG-928-A07]
MGCPDSPANTISAVFLDRDGVINVDSPDYIRHENAFHPIPGSLRAISRLTRVQVPVIVITNQSGIGRGLFSMADLDAIHQKLHQMTTTCGGTITDIFFCPHRPDEGCDCRKPRPGLLIQASLRHRIDLSAAVMIGDSAKDILAGKAAGCGRTLLVKTGNGRDALARLSAAGDLPDDVVDDLGAAVTVLLTPGSSNLS